ncbi:MAG: single-stranded DNA-binding protein [Candidatus Kapaibacterium sp.]
MAKSLNRAQFIGNLGHDPELRTTPQGTSVCTIRIATTETFRDQSGELRENTDWHSIVLWDKLANIAAEYLSKGSRVYVEGRIKNRSYEDKEGVTRYVTEMVCNNMIMLDGGRGGSSGSPGAGQQARDNSTGTYSGGNESQIPDEDDVPF